MTRCEGASGRHEVASGGQGGLAPDRKRLSHPCFATCAGLSERLVLSELVGVTNGDESSRGDVNESGGEA